MESVIVKPLITEKATRLQDKRSQYSFIVGVNANKIEIMNAISSTYGVTVTDVNTCNYIGKKSVRYTKKGFSSGRKNFYKKAVVTLKKGDSIDFFANI